MVFVIGTKGAEGLVHDFKLWMESNHPQIELQEWDEIHDGLFDEEDNYLESGKRFWMEYSQDKELNNERF